MIIAVQVFWLDGHASTIEVEANGTPDLIVYWDGSSRPGVYFRLDAGRYVECRNVVNG